MSDGFYLEIQGWCPICETPATFIARHSWLRGSLFCQSCENGSSPRERALALVLARTRPNWRDLVIHESSPMKRGVAMKLQRECKGYIASHYFPGRPFGAMVNGFRNESLEALTFPDNAHDIVITLDVFEHVFHPDWMMREIWRTLKPGGVYVATFPILRAQVEALKPRARRETDGSVTHLEPAQYHGNPISGEGALVTFDYGYDIHKQIAEWAPFDVEISRFQSRRMGILGEFLEVVVCGKPE
ncbi:MAG: class I SAM-dependent methyltransferase [Parvularculaceae bacterium]